MDRGSINSFSDQREVWWEGRFERPTPCAQGSFGPPAKVLFSMASISIRCGRPVEPC